MKRTIPFLVFITACSALCGCGGALMGEGYRGIIEAGREKEACWTYQAASYDLPKQKLNKTVTVLPFADGRQTKFENHFLRCCAPLVLYCTDVYEPPEKQSNRNFLMYVHRESSASESRVTFNPREDFARALVEELQAGNMFREVTFDNAAGPYDYVINGKILDTTLQDTMYSYGGMGIFLFAWGFGLPAGSFSNDLSVEITCTETRTGVVVHSKVYTAPRYRRVYWMYRQLNGCNYGEMLQAINRLFIEELSSRLLERKDQGDGVRS